MSANVALAESDWLSDVEVVEQGWCAEESGAFFTEGALRGLILHLESAEGAAEASCDLRIRMLENDLYLQIEEHRLRAERLRASHDLMQDNLLEVESELRDTLIRNTELNERAKNRFYLGLVTGTLGASILWTVLVFAL